MASQKGYDGTYNPYSQQPYYQQPPPVPPKDNTKTIMIIVAIVVIVIVVLAIITPLLVYWQVSDLLDNPPGSRPTVSLTQADIGMTTATVHISSVDPAGKELAEFKAVLIYNGTSEGGTISPLTNGGSGGSLTFIDMDGGGTLSGGDRFTIDIVPDTDYELTLYFGVEKLVSRTFTTI